jgi:hypothetical protein
MAIKFNGQMSVEASNLKWKATLHQTITLIPIQHNNTYRLTRPNKKQLGKRN